MNRFRTTVCGSVLAIGMLAASGARGELIVNGGFEDGLNNWTFTGTGTNVASISTDTPSGTGNSADLDIHNVFQWAVSDHDLRQIMSQLDFEEVYYRNHGRFLDSTQFENHAFIYIKNGPSSRSE